MALPMDPRQPPPESRLKHIFVLFSLLVWHNSVVKSLLYSAAYGIMDIGGGKPGHHYILWYFLFDYTKYDIL